MSGISLEQAVVLFILMLVAQGPSVAAALVGFFKSKAAIEKNTEVTKAGTEAAAVSAKAAATAAATSAKAAATNTAAVSEISRKLNGGIDEAISAAVTPIQMVLSEHTAKDERDKREIKERFDLIEQYIHDRNHDMMNAMATISSNVNILLRLNQEK